MDNINDNNLPDESKQQNNSEMDNKDTKADASTESDTTKEEDFSESLEQIKAKRKPPKKCKKKTHSVSYTIIIVTVILCASVLLSIFTVVIGKDAMGIGGDDDEVEFEIDNSKNLNDVVKMLHENNIIEWPGAFKSMCSISKKKPKIKAGFYTFKKNMSYFDIIKILNSGGSSKNEIVKIMFPEGITLYDAAVKLQENGVCDAERFLHEFNFGNVDHLDFDDTIPKDELKLFYAEGYFFPDTYEFVKGQSVESVAKKVKINFNNKVYSQYMGEIKKRGLELDDVLTLASMIQKEAPNYEDMQKVSSVFWNRLNNSKSYPLLQSDPTKNYSDNYVKKYEDTKNENRWKAYNTYEGEGLPPGAICNPGIEAIEAALNPADTKYMYFCADIKTKQIYYATTLEQHNANLRKAGINK